ncbi:MAG: methyltransferase domain-containing protein [Cyclobacteriaceae bacterium]|nr:methyltransferase domain-containing protein [Cyclobacteriaceae bacterium]
MTCTHCCDANKFFDIKNAQKELKKFNKKGPKGTTRRLIKVLNTISKSDLTLLDIGGGIGMLQWYFLKNGAKSTTDVDASTGYLEAAKQYAAENNWKEKTTFIEGDFNDHNEKIGHFDVVTLDRVVCCYPDFHTILKNATEKSNQYIALSYPMSNWASRFINQLGRIYFYFRKSAFKTYIHPSKQIRQLIVNQGFSAIHTSIKFPWHIQVYKKTT